MQKRQLIEEGFASVLFTHWPGLNADQVERCCEKTFEAASVQADIETGYTIRREDQAEDLA